MAKKQKRQDIRIAITSKGERYCQELVTKGFVNITSEQRTEWDILQDLMSETGMSYTSDVGTRLVDFLAERHDTIIGRKLQFFAERGERGQIASESYARTLHRLIKEGYISSWIHQKAEEQI